MELQFWGWGESKTHRVGAELKEPDVKIWSLLWLFKIYMMKDCNGH